MKVLQLKNISNVVLVGGSSEDFEVPEMLMEEFANYKIVCDDYSDIKANINNKVNEYAGYVQKSSEYEKYATYVYRIPTDKTYSQLNVAIQSKVDFLKVNQLHIINEKTMPLVITTLRSKDHNYILKCCSGFFATPFNTLE